MKGKSLILVLALVAPSLGAQEKKPWVRDRLCGKLEHVRKIPDSKHADTFLEKRKALRNVSMALFERRENEACCEATNAIETAQTRNGGHFEFKTRRAGSYWLRVTWDGKEYKVPVVYEPEKNSTTMCSQQGIELEDDGTADWWAIVTVE